MTAYVIRRLLLAIPTLFLVSVIVFSILRLIPGDVAEAMTEEYAYAPTIDALRQKLGLDRPLPVQYAIWVWDALRGDFGNSLWNRQSVFGELFRRLPVTLELGGLALLISAIVAVPIGVYSGLRQDTKTDYALRSSAIFFLSVPHFWLATLILIFPAYYLGWAPRVVWTPFAEDPIANLQHVITPALIIGLGGAAPMMRLTRAMILEVQRQDYIRTAWSKGLRERAVVFRHALKNAIIPVVTLFGLRIPTLISGAVVMENVFGLPGVGRWIVVGIQNFDYPVVQIGTLFLAVIVVITNLLIDLTYGWLDPRIRFA